MWINSRTPSTKHVSMFLSYILDDRIISSWYLNILNIRLNVFYYVQRLIQILEGLSTSYYNKF